ncbi:MAG TPA: FG-GAP-like repeat-containing protein, partial [Pyrinomonadaceae bacterium]|nr:FG-GAP-like repeat-containing protein [Pyrinomonadaceae bacterium]
MSHQRNTTRTFTHLLAIGLVFLALIHLKDVPKGLAAGCGAPQFGKNPPNANSGVQPRSIAVGDFNQDGKNDLATANYGSGQGSPSGSISVLLNLGSGSFSPQINLSAGINPRSIVTADFNSDGRLDLSVLNYNSGACCISGFATTFLGDGAGNFAAAGPPVGVGNDPRAMTTGDFNKDGKVDLIATLSNASVAVLLGDGSGSFGAATTFPAGASATSIAAGDLNADGNTDVVLGSIFGQAISVLLGNGTGGFGASTLYNNDAFARFVALGDFNLDAKLDVATATSSNKVSVLLGTGSGTLGSPTQFTLPDSPESVVVQDFNGDGKPDLATTQNTGNTVSVLIGDGNGSFGPPANYAGGGGPFFGRSSDFDGDGKPDLAVANISSNTVSVMIGDGMGGLGGGRSFSVGFGARNLGVGDFNKDGSVDLVASNDSQGSISVLFGNGTGGFGSDVKYPVRYNPRDLVVEDFNADGNLDLAIGHGTCCDIPDSVSILLGTASGAFGLPTNISPGGDAWAIASGDFNNDGKPDLATANNSSNSVSVLLGNGAGAFAALVNVPLPASPSELETGDFNGDGNTDLLVGANILFVLSGNGAGGFSVGPSFGAGGVRVAVGDVNGDGKADLATANGTQDRLSVLMGDGAGSFGPPSNIPLTQVTDVIFGDVNGDGKTDIVASTHFTSFTVLTGDGTGAFGTSISFNAGGGGGGMLATDLNGDGKTDIAGPGASNVTVLLNSCTEAPAIPPQLTISDESSAEGNSGQTTHTFAVTLSAASTQTVTASYSTIGQSANSGVDYQSMVGRVTFAPGVTTQNISINVVGDSNLEGNEMFLVQLRDVLNATVADSTGQGTILNDDSAVQIASSTYSVNEGSGVASVIASRLGDLSAAATINYATSDSAALNECNVMNGAGSSRCDYATSIGTLRFAAGEGSKTIFVPIVDDGYAEGNETFTVTLSNPTGTTLGATTAATVTIQDNDSSSGANPIDGNDFFIRQQYIDFLG